MSAVTKTRFVEALAATVGGAHVLTDPGEMAPYLLDWRKQFSGPAECVVRPASTGEVAAVVAQCAAAGVAIVPQGGNTGLCGGSVPGGAQREIVLSLARMNRIRAIDALNDTLTAEAGCVLADIQRADGSWHNYYLPSGGRDDAARAARHARDLHSEARHGAARFPTGHVVAL